MVVTALQWGLFRCVFIDMVDLERKLRDAVLDGRPISHRPWRKILIIVEGIYRSAMSTPEFLFSVHSITAFSKI